MAKPKSKKRPPDVRRPGASGHLARTAAKSLLALGLAFGLLVTLAHLGERAGTAVAPHSRYAVAFADIETTPPPGRDLKTFLTEVRFLGDLPETLQTVDPNLADHLKAAFRRHPWVLDVPSVAVSAPGRIRVETIFRKPALAIRIGTERNPRALDRMGVLLPADAPTAKLPVFDYRIVPTNTPAGQKWPDPDVQRAVELVQLYPCERIERVHEGWQISRAGKPLLRIAAP